MDNSTKTIFEKESSKSKWFHIRMEMKYCTPKIAAGICTKLNSLFYISDEIKISKNNKQYKEAIVCIRDEPRHEDVIKTEILKVVLYIYLKTEEKTDSNPMNGFIYVKAIHLHTNVCYFFNNFYINPAFLRLCEQECNATIPHHLKAYAEIVDSVDVVSEIKIPNIQFSDINQWNNKLLSSNDFQKSIKSPANALKRKKRIQVVNLKKRKRL